MPTKSNRNSRNPQASKIFLLLLIFAAAAASYAMDKNYIRLDSPVAIASESSNFKGSGFNLTYNLESKASFYSDGTGSFFYCTVDGIKYMSQDGTSPWDFPLTMTNPVLLGQGSFACVAETDGRILYLYSKSGENYRKELDGKILFFSLNENGYVSVLTKEGSERKTLVFSPEGNELFQLKHQTENIFPMASDVSLDGRIIAMSFVNINKVSLETNLVFSYIDPAERRSNTSQDPNGTFRAQDFMDQLIPTLKFMDGNVLVYMSDTQVGGIYPDGKTSQDDWTFALNNKLEAVTFIGSKNFAVINGDGILNQEAEPVGLLKIYDTGGKSIAEYETGSVKKTSYFYSDGNNILRGDGREFQSIGLNGKLNYSYNSAQDVKQLIYLGNINTLLQATDTSAEILKKTKSDKIKG